VVENLAKLLHFLSEKKEKSQINSIISHSVVLEEVASL
jgi:hypothetical protein